MALKQKKVKTTSTTCTTTDRGLAKNVLTANIIALQRNKVIIGADVGVDNRIPISTVQAHLMQYRYMLSKDAFEQLSKCDLSEIEEFHNQAIAYLKTMMGGKTSPQPLYKNFPAEVMSKTDSELYWNAMAYYWTNSKWKPLSVEMDRPVEFENIKYNILKPVDLKGFEKIFTDLVSINTSLTPQDLNVVKWFANMYKDSLKVIMPDKIPFKENLMTLAGMGIPVPVKTPTDVLRIAVHMSGGDISLPAVPPKMIKGGRYSRGMTTNPERKKFEFKSFSRPQRRYLLGLLEQTHCNPAEMVLKDQRWVRLGEILHPGEYKEKFPRCFKAFYAIRNTKVRSWYSKLNILYVDLNLEKGLEILAERPGEFVRRLDWLVRTFDDKKSLELIFSHLQKVMEESSNKVLFEVYTHFEGRSERTVGRSVFVKGARKKTPLPELAALPAQTIEDLQSTIFVALRTKFRKLEALGNVWIDPELKKIPVPTNMRSLNLSLKPTVRGSRMPFDNPDAKVIRPFVHWQGPVDLDLSVTFVGSKMRPAVLSFSSLRMGQSCHSGDVLGQRGPCAEYIDIQIEDAVKSGYQYAVVDLRNFGGGSLKKHEAVFGLMEREHPLSNKTWLPESITTAQQLEASGSVSIIGILDLVTKEFISLDLDSSGITARGDIASTMSLIDQYAKPPKFSVYDLLHMHAEVRGKIVTLEDNVDTYFKFEDFIASYEQTGKYML